MVEGRRKRRMGKGRRMGERMGMVRKVWGLGPKEKGMIGRMSKSEELYP